MHAFTHTVPCLYSHQRQFMVRCLARGHVSRLMDSGIEPSTLCLVDDPFYHLSHSHPYNQVPCIQVMLSWRLTERCTVEGLLHRIALYSGVLYCITVSTRSLSHTQAFLWSERVRGKQLFPFWSHKNTHQSFFVCLFFCHQGKIHAESVLWVIVETNSTWLILFFIASEIYQTMPMQWVS